MKTLFMYLPDGKRFQAMNGDALIKRAGNSRTTYCAEEGATVYLNAIVPGIPMDLADNTQFVHICPMDYVWVE